MNSKALQKHYDKLTTDERFSAMIAALGRDDMTEYQTLAQTAPRGKTYQVRDTHGILDAFEWLGMFHVLMQLGEMAILYFLLFHTDGEGAVKVNYHGTDGVEEEIYCPDEAIELVMRHIVEGREAWRAICEDHNVDPNDALSRLPWVEVVELNEIIARAVLEEKGIKPDDTQHAIEAYRKAIKTKREEWE